MPRWARQLDKRGGTRGNVANRDVRHRRDSVGAVLQASERSAQERRIGTTVRNGGSRRTFVASVPAGGLLAIVVAAVTLGGCATAAPTLASRFVRHGKPTIDLGGPPPPRASYKAARDAASRPIVEVSRYSPSVAEVEIQNLQLRKALLAVRLDPTLANHLEAAKAYQRLGIMDQAYDQLQGAAVLDTNSAAVNDAMARVWRDWGLPQLGLSNAYRAVHAAPSSATAKHTLGTLFYALGLRREAQSAFTEVVRLDPQAWYGWQNLCTLSLADGRTQEAITYCQRATAARRAELKKH